TDEERRAYDWFATQLANQAKDEIPDSVRSRTLLLRGTPSAEIAQCAQREDVDLIVMATSGRSGLKDVLLGSTAERVLRQSPCPVLTVHREHARGFIAQAEEEPWSDWPARGRAVIVRRRRRPRESPPLPCSARGRRGRAAPAPRADRA